MISTCACDENEDIQEVDEESDGADDQNAKVTVDELNSSQFKMISQENNKGSALEDIANMDKKFSQTQIMRQTTEIASANMLNTSMNNNPS